MVNLIRGGMQKVFGKKAFRRFSWKDWAYVKPRFSQFGEDAYLEELFLGINKGFYVEVGAFHPQMYSNTYNLYKRGWSGICIEPNPAVQSEFKKIRGKDTLLNCGVLDQEGEMEYFSYEGCGAVNTFDTEFAQGLEGGALKDKKKVFKLPVRRLDNILDEHLPEGKSIDFISVDCEGSDFRVLKSNNWQKYRPRVVLVEDHGGEVETEICKYMKEQGYKFFNWVGPTKFFRDTRVS